MITVLLQQILDLLTAHFPGVISLLEKLNLIEPDVEEIRQDVDAIRNTTSVMSGTLASTNNLVGSIRTNTDGIASNVIAIRNNTNTISNNISTISTNTGRAASFAEDCANNTLDIDQKITSIASDTTQMRSDNQVLISNTNDIETLIGMGLAKDVNQDAGSFETDLTDNLKSMIVNIPPDTNGISGFNIIKTKLNILGGTRLLKNSQNYVSSGTIDLVNKTFTFSSGASTTPGVTFSNNMTFKPHTEYTFIFTAAKTSGNGFNIRIYYTDGTYLNISGTGTAKNTVVITTLANKTVDSVRKTNASGSTILYYEECGIFEGVYTEADFLSYTEEVTPVSFTSITDGGKLDLTNGYLYKPDNTIETLTPLNVRADIGYNYIYTDIGALNFTYDESLSKYISEINQEGV